MSFFSEKTIFSHDHISEKLFWSSEDIFRICWKALFSKWDFVDRNRPPINIIEKKNYFILSFVYFYKVCDLTERTHNQKKSNKMLIILAWKFKKIFDGSVCLGYPCFDHKTEHLFYPSKIVFLRNKIPVIKNKFIITSKADFLCILYFHRCKLDFCPFVAWLYLTYMFSTFGKPSFFFIWK